MHGETVRSVEMTCKFPRKRPSPEGYDLAPSRGTVLVRQTERAFSTGGSGMEFSSWRLPDDHLALPRSPLFEDEQIIDERRSGHSRKAQGRRGISHRLEPFAAVPRAAGSRRISIAHEGGVRSRKLKEHQGVGPVTASPIVGDIRRI